MIQVGKIKSGTSSILIHPIKHINAIENLDNLNPIPDGYKSGSNFRGEGADSACHDFGVWELAESWQGTEIFDQMPMCIVYC